MFKLFSIKTRNYPETTFKKVETGKLYLKFIFSLRNFQKIMSVRRRHIVEFYCYLRSFLFIRKRINIYDLQKNIFAFAATTSYPAQVIFLGENNFNFTLKRTIQPAKKKFKELEINTARKTKIEKKKRRSNDAFKRRKQYST